MIRMVDLGGVGDGSLRSAIRMAIADEALGTALATALERTLAVSPVLDDARPVVRLRTRKRLETLGAERIGDAYVVVAVRADNARRLPSLVAAIRALRPAGVQIVWDGVSPPREDVEAFVFAALENARATPGEPPVVVAASRDVCFALRVLVRERESRARPKDPR